MNYRWNCLFMVRIHIFRQMMERWLSGLKQRFAKASTVIGPQVRILPSPQIFDNMAHKHDITWQKIAIFGISAIILLPFLPIILLVFFGVLIMSLVKGEKFKKYFGK